ncbi:MAG TPA: hypothetical protein GX012_02190 [Acholeplasma sp.]|nr:hypothetical protein [Acholeplasma sp.]
MKKKSNRALIFSMFFYVTSLLTVTLNQIFIYKQIVAINEINFFSILIITISLSLFLINHFVFISIRKENINIKAIINIAIKIVLYYLTTIMIVNELVLNTPTIIFSTLFLILKIIDIVTLVINFRKINVLILNNDDEILKQEKEFKVKVLKKSEDFKFFQLNIFLLLIAIFSIYLVDTLIDYSNEFHMILYCTVLLSALILSIKYVHNISKISDAVKFYHYLSSVISVLAVSLILYLDANLLIFLLLIPLVPILKLDIDVRKIILKEHKEQ